ncbi:hypothetical protein PR202_ga22039 [Eleusine coracana subsp. coracana]|uniref:KIB1-4 beta-propeller domain-containing protein n=1 Tax=Eleusine coracana subsp. coracana TaxID=191504 RepID=A0AAV5D2K2_ELECO|nr:hypothetical protein PR202_ga22039 [Eleusine coracana subsp. coracana]
MHIVMHALDIPSLLHAGAVRRVRFPITDASPCLLYVLSILNPLTGAQLALPPVTSLSTTSRALRATGATSFMLGSPCKGRDCIVLVHRPDGQLSFARVGVDRWTHVTGGSLTWDTSYRDALYNSMDGLFYVLSFDGSMITLYCNGSSPVAKDIMPEAIPWNDPIEDLVRTPWGNLLQDPVKVTSIGHHALFLGFNSAVCLPTKDFPELTPNYAYVTDGFEEEMCGGKHNVLEIGIWIQ